MSKEPNKNAESEETVKPVDASVADGNSCEVDARLKRENAEPVEGNATTPMMVFLGAMVLCLWLGFYFHHSSPAGVRWDVFDPNFNPTSSIGGPKEYDPVAKGKKVYNNCIACHQASGAGLPGVYPPLAGSDWIAKSPEVLTRIVLNGLSGEIVVNGETYNNAMTPFNHLDDKKIAEVLSYVRNSWGNAYGVVSEAEVAAVRASVGSRTAPFTAAELLEKFPD